MQRRLYIDEAHTALDIFRFAVFLIIEIGLSNTMNHLNSKKTPHGVGGAEKPGFKVNSAQLELSLGLSFAKSFTSDARAVPISRQILAYIG